MRRVLFVSYYFPPIGGAGAQRPLRMVQHLADRGYSSVVVTGSGQSSDRWAPRDDDLELAIPPDTEIHRIPGPEPEGLTGWPGRAERWLRRPGPWAQWLAQGTMVEALRAGADTPLVYTWLQPYVSAEAGFALARELGIPWVADLGDPWALDEMMVYPSRIHRELDLRLMGSLLGGAAAIVMSTREAARRLVGRLPHLGDRPIVVIPNGYDADDFALSIEPRSDGVFRIVHTGYLHTELGNVHRRTRIARRALGGAVAGVDILTRSHIYLLEALDRLLLDDPTLRNTVEVHLAGVTSRSDVEAAERSRLVRMPGYVTHDQAVSLMRTADLLFLPMQNLPRGTRATIVPGKMYEYLASRTPVLAAIPDGDARTILEDAGNALICRPDDVSAMAEALRKAIDRWRSGEPKLAPDPAVVARYEYRQLASQLAGVFDEVLASRG